MASAVSVSSDGKKRRGPKVRGPLQVGRINVSTRIGPTTKDKLEAACAENGRSLAQEIEWRLDQSFKAEEVVGSRDLHRLQQLIAFAITSIEGDTGKGFGSDWATFAKAIAAVETIIRAFRPEMSAELRAWFADIGEDPGAPPESPTPPKKPSQGGLLFAHDPTPEEQASYEKALADYEGDLLVWALKEHTWRTRSNEVMQKLRERVNWATDLSATGKMIAEMFLPQKEG